MISFRTVLLFVLLVAPIAADAQAVRVAQDEFTLGPGDVVRVAIWREKDLSGDFQVDESGQLTLPLLGTHLATALPWVDLRDSLMLGYRRELKAPSVTLSPLRRVYVLGEVARPGLYFADPTMSFAGVVALAGGANAQGDLRNVRVVRNGEVILRNASIEGQLSRSGVRSEDQIFVDVRGWFDRNSVFVASAAISVTSIIVSLIRR